MLEGKGERGVDDILETAPRYVTTGGTNIYPYNATNRDRSVNKEANNIKQQL